jgi:hypothetical protein
MKIISISILSIALSISLFARLNPFEPTDQFLEQKAMIIKANDKEAIQQEQEAINQKAQEMEDQKLAIEAETEAIKLKEQKIALIEKEEQEQAIKFSRMEKEIEETIILPKKPYIPEIKENFKVLPFVKIFVVNDVLTIKVDTKYKLLNQDILKPVKKLLFDFEGNVSFYTVRKEIISESFKSLAVGTHMEDNFFRIVIDLPYDIINYSEKIDSENGIITIRKK